MKTKKEQERDEIDKECSKALWIIMIAFLLFVMAIGAMLKLLT